MFPGTTDIFVPIARSSGFIKVSLDVILLNCLVVFSFVSVAHGKINVV